MGRRERWAVVVVYKMLQFTRRCQEMSHTSSTNLSALHRQFVGVKHTLHTRWNVQQRLASNLNPAAMLKQQPQSSAARWPVLITVPRRIGGWVGLGSCLLLIPVDLRSRENDSSVHTHGSASNCWINFVASVEIRYHLVAVAERGGAEKWGHLLPSAAGEGCETASPK